ncbi:MAG: hypothetical protein NTW20_15505 [Rhodobacterales bacterium]|nr:hypothetical protein [Rhodobacterales bacterium]
MLFKIILVFLALMALVALVGRVLFPGALPKVMRKKSTPPVCARCGRYLIGRATCDCDGKAGGRKRK